MPLSESYTSGDALPATDVVEFAKYINRSFKAGLIQDFFGLSADIPSGYLAAAGGTIGDASSSASLRANADMETLFAILWAVGNANGTLSIFTSAGAASTYGANAAADFAAHKRIAVPNLCDMVTPGSGTFVKVWTVSAVDSGTNLLTVPSNSMLQTGQVVVYNNSGGSAPGGLTSGNTYYIYRADATHVGLFANAVDVNSGGGPIDLSTNGSGTHTLTQTLTARNVGDQTGEETHMITVADLPPLSTNDIEFSLGGGATKRYVGTNGSVTAGSSKTRLTSTDLLAQPVLNMQPSTFVNKIICTGVVW